MLPLSSPTHCPCILQFGQQEPGSSAEIAQFAKSQGASFQLFQKIDVNGDSAAPLFTWLKANTHGAGWEQGQECRGLALLSQDAVRFSRSMQQGLVGSAKPLRGRALGKVDEERS